MAYGLVISAEEITDLASKTVEGQELISAENWADFGKLCDDLALQGGYQWQGNGFYTKTASSTESFNQLITELGESNSSSIMVKPTTIATNQTGGTTTVAEVVEFKPATATAGAGATAVTAGSIAGSTSLLAFGGAVIAGTGLGLMANESENEFWVGFCNAVGSAIIPGFDPIDTVEEAQYLHISSLIGNDGYTYVPVQAIEAAMNYMREKGAYDLDYTADIVYVDPNSPVTVTTNGSLAEVAGYVASIARHQGLSVNKRPATIHQLLGDIYEAIREDGGDLSRCNYFMAQLGYSDEGTSSLAVTCSEYNNEPIYFGEQQSSYGRIWQESRAITSYGFSYSVTGYNTIDTNEYVSFVGNRTYPNVRQWIAFLGVHKIDEHNAYTSNINSTIHTGGYALLPNQGNALLPNDPASIAQSYPEWYANRKTIGSITGRATGAGTYEPTITLKDYLPLSTPIANINEGISNATDALQKYAQTGKNENPKTDPTVVKDYNDLINFLGGVFNPTNPPSKPEGDTPKPVVPSIGGDSVALFTVYNPVKANLDAMGSVLWTNNIIQQLVEIFSNNPMDAIISLQLIYATPTTGASKNIKLGYIDCGSASACPVVTEPYVSIDCGTVDVFEYFGDARDYSPFTSVTAYLPFIGMRELKTEDIIGSKVNIRYTVDVLTATVLCEIEVAKSGVKQVLYTYEGNCGTYLPLTGADKSRMISSAVSVIGGATIGGLVGAGMMASGVLAPNKASIQKSGNFSGNAGAMAIKKPYLIINRSVPYEAENYNTLYGFPSNAYVTLSSCSGFTRVKDVHVDNIENALEEEKLEIESLLKAGVIIN